MPSLLDQDFMLGRDGLPMPRIEPPSDGLLATGTPTWADAWQFNKQAAGDWIDEQRAISEARGLWNPETGLPTAAGVVDAAGQTAQGILMGSTAPKGIRAYHGSPHDFDAFDTSKIGTGEGAQAYGHGLYFADREAIAQWYRDQLAPKSFNGLNWNAATPEQIAASAAEEFGSREAAARWLTDEAPIHDYGEPGGKLEQAVSVLNSKAPLTPLKPGKMYEVSISADPEHFLDWDKRLSEQHPKVQEAVRATGVIPDPAEVNAAGHFGYSLNEFKTLTPEYQRELIAKLPAKHANYADDPRGSEIYQQLERANRYSHPNYDQGLLPPPDWQPPAGGAAAVLRDAGVPGIRYLDATSRRAGEGSRNYVAFDASQIEILRKYLALLTAGGAGGVAAGSRQ